MAIRKRVWTTKAGEQKEAWLVDYLDQEGKRRSETFNRKRDADARLVEIKNEIRLGIHTAVGQSRTVEQAAYDWLRYVELEKRERSTLDQYRVHVEKHILPRIGREKLANLTTPRISAFRDGLLASMSRALARKVLTSTKSLLKDAQRRGHVAQNVARDVRIGIDKRGKRKLVVGVDIPTPDEIRHIVQAGTGKWRPILITLIFTGLRSSELRGLRWTDVDVKRGLLHVRQRADRYNKIGRPKSEAGERTVPIGPFVVNTLKEWKLTCPESGALELVFPTSRGHIVRHENIVRYGLWPTQLAAGVAVPVLDKTGKAKLDKEGRVLVTAKYTGLHALRHFYASWLINRRADGGLELPPKIVQERLGHASIGITMDVYGHLFPGGDNEVEQAAGERALLTAT